MSAAVMLVMALLPGIPMLPFLVLGGGAGALAYVIDKRQKAGRRRRRPKTGRGRRAAAAPKSRSRAALKIDDLKIELGYALLPLVNSPDGGDRLTEQIKALRRSLAIEMGFVMPAVRILDNVQLEANTYVIKIKEVEAGTGRIWPGQYMVMDPTGAQVKLPGMHTTEPTFGLPATWVDVGAEGGGGAQGLHRGRRRDRAVDASDRAAQGQHRRSSSPTPRCRSSSRSCRRSRRELVKDIVPSADHRVRHPARAAAPARRAHLDPRPRAPSSKASPTRCRSRAIRSPSPSTCAPASPARSAPSTPRRGGYLPLIALSAQVGAGLRRIDRRPGRRAQPRHAAVAAVGVHHRWCASASRTPPARARRRCWSPRRRPAVRARHRRALPRPDQRDVAVGNPPAGPAEDRRQHLGSWPPAARRSTICEPGLEHCGGLLSCEGKPEWEGRRTAPQRAGAGTLSSLPRVKRR